MLADLRPGSSSCKSAFQASSTKALFAPDITSTLSLICLFSLPPSHSIPNTLLPTLPLICFQSSENRWSVSNICFLSSNTNLLSSKLAQNSGLEERVQWEGKEEERNVSSYENYKHWGKCGGVLERPYFPKSCSPLAFQKYFLFTNSIWPFMKLSLCLQEVKGFKIKSQEFYLGSNICVILNLISVIWSKQKNRWTRNILDF